MPKECAICKKPIEETRHYYLTMEKDDIDLSYLCWRCVTEIAITYNDCKIQEFELTAELAEVLAAIQTGIPVEVSDDAWEELVGNNLCDQEPVGGEADDELVITSKGRAALEAYQLGDNLIQVKEG